MKYHRDVLTTRRLVAGSTVLLLLFAAAAPALAACTGWLASARDRHTCCARLGDLASEATVTDCCAMAEQSSGLGDRETPVPVPMRPGLAAALFLVPSPDSHASLPDRVPVQAASPPKYVLLGSFLI